MPSMSWGSLLESHLWFDWLAIIFVVTGLGLGLKRGLMRELVLIAEFCAIIYVTMEYSGFLAEKFHGNFPEPLLAYDKFLIFIALAIAAWFAVSFLDRMMKAWIKTEMIAPIKTAGGAIFGCLHYLLVVSMLAQALLLFPSEEVQAAFKPGASRFGGLIAALAPAVHDHMDRFVRALGEQMTQLS